MRHISKAFLGLVTAGCLALAGCQKLSHEQTYTLESGDVKALEISAPKGDQQVAVEVSGSAVPINVHIVLEDDKAAAMDKLTFGGKVDASKILASQEKMTTGKVEAKVPGGKAFAVLLSGAEKKTEVKVKVTGQ